MHDFVFAGGWSCVWRGVFLRDWSGEQKQLQPTHCIFTWRPGAYQHSWPWQLLLLVTLKEILSLVRVLLGFRKLRNYNTLCTCSCFRYQMAEGALWIDFILICRFYPLLFLLIIGTVFFLSGFFALFRIRREIKRSTTISSTTEMIGGQRSLLWDQSNEVQKSIARAGAARLEILMVN